MARLIKTETSTLTITTEQRTRTFEVRSPKGEPPLFVAIREILELDQNGHILTRREGRTITRRWDQILADPIAVGIAAKLPDLLDRWEAEDEKAEQPPA